MWLFLAIVLVPCLFFQWIYKNFTLHYRFWAELNVPYLEPSFPFGNIGAVLKQTVHFAHVIQGLYKQLKDRGDYVGIYFIRDPVLLVLSPEFARKVLVKDFNFFVDHGMYSNEEVDPLSANLFFIEGDRWRKLRSKLAPTFTSSKLKTLFHTVVEVGTRLDHHLARRCPVVQKIDIKDLLARFLTDVIGTCAFGIECNSLSNPNSQFRVMGKKMINLSRLKALKVFLAMRFPRQARLLGMGFNSKDVSDFFLSVVRDTIRYREENDVRRDDFMQILIDMMKKNGDVDGDGLTFEEIAAQAFVFFFAGFETSATTMTCALDLLAKHPDVQRKARKCVRKVLAKHGGELSYEAVMEMEYVGYIINETLRLYPPVASLHRMTTQPYQLPNGSVLPQGTGVIISNLGFHHDPEHFPDPFAFKPERFATMSEWKNNFTYLPFGEGPRMCIGIRFGLLQTRLGLAMLLRNYNFSIDPNDTTDLLHIDPVLLLHGPKGEVLLNVQRITTV